MASAWHKSRRAGSSPGDSVSIEIEKIGTLTNPVIEEA